MKGEGTASSYGLIGSRFSNNRRGRDIECALNCQSAGAIHSNGLGNIQIYGCILFDGGIVYPYLQSASPELQGAFSHASGSCRRVVCDIIQHQILSSQRDRFSCGIKSANTGGVQL